MEKIEQSVLDQYPHGTGIIRLRLHGVIKDWAISVHPGKDNEESLRAHLKRWVPEAEFIAWAIKY